MKQKDKESHTAKIMKALLRGEKLTTLGIINRFKCVDARKRLSEINQIHRLTKEWVEKKGKRFLRYSIPICLALFMISCEQPAKEEKNKITKTYTKGSFSFVEIDSCEYILSSVFSGNSITHKGNCKNPIHGTERK